MRRRITGGLVFLFWTVRILGAVPQYYTPPICADTVRALTSKRFHEPKRPAAPTMNINQCMRDIYYLGMDYFETNYSQEIVNFVKPIYNVLTSESYYGMFTDEHGDTFITCCSKGDPRYYLDSLQQYLQICPPVLIYNKWSRTGDVYQIPLAYKDTIKAYVAFYADSLKRGPVGWADAGNSFLFGLTEFPTVDSVEADSLFRDTLPPDEQIIDQRLFRLWGALPYWTILTETQGKAGSDSAIHWLDPIKKRQAD